MGLHCGEVPHGNEHHVLSCRHDDVHHAFRENDHVYDRGDHGHHAYDHDCVRGDAHDLFNEHEFLYVLVRKVKLGRLASTFQQMKQTSNYFSC